MNDMAWLDLDVVHCKEYRKAPDSTTYNTCVVLPETEQTKDRNTHWISTPLNTNNDLVHRSLKPKHNLESAAQDTN